MATGGPTHAILMIFCIIMCSGSVLSKDIYIKASLNDRCLGSPCLTLTQFSQIADLFKVCHHYGSVLCEVIQASLSDHCLGSPCFNLTQFSQIAFMCHYHGSVLCKVILNQAFSNDRCLLAGSHCVTLSQFPLIANYFTNNASDLTLIFGAGNHSLESELQITSKTSFSMFGNATLFSNHSVVIACDEHGRFTFIGVHKVYMTGLNYVNCLGNKLESVDQFIIEDSKFKGKKWNQYDSDGSLIEVFGHTSAHFIRTSFEQNEFGKSIIFEAIVNNGREPLFISKLDFNVGGAIYAEESKIELVECLFEKNKADVGGAIFIWRSSEITVTRTSFIKNSARYMGHNDSIVLSSVVSE